MKCIIVGSDHSAALEHCYKNHLLEQGVTTEIFPIQNLFLDYYHKSLIHKALVRSNLSGIFESLNDKLRKKIEEGQPDWIWIFKGMEVLPSTIQWIKERGIRVVNFNPDNPYIFSGRGSGNKNVTHSISKFDHYFSYDANTVKKLGSQSVPSSLLPFGHNVSDALYSQIVENSVENIKACFVGMPDKHRASFIVKLANYGNDIDCYGDGWDIFVKHPRVKCFPSVYGNEFWTTLHQYRVQLNYMRPHNLHSHNMRTFEIPAIGGIQVAPHTKDHGEFFENDREIFLYNNELECSRQIHNLIGRDKAEADRIRSCSRRTCLEKGYSYAHRTKSVLDVVNRILH